MKKQIAYLIIVFVVSTLSCKKTVDPTSNANCSADAIAEYSVAIKAWTADVNNKTRCQAVITIAQKVLNCPGATTAQRKQFQDYIDSKPCN